MVQKYRENMRSLKKNWFEQHVGQVCLFIHAYTFVEDNVLSTLPKFYELLIVGS
jgi:hypothetical protein